MESLVKKLKQELRYGKKKGKDMRERRFLENGSIFLEELIADCNGKSVPIRSFPSDQILKATNNFDLTCFISEEAYYRWYRGKIEDRSYMFKRFSDDQVTGHRVGEVYNDIVLSARMSNHSNFLKLLGCCLEFPFPVLVFESAQHGVLNQRGGIMVNGEESLLPLSIRLKIANALAYLHMAFPKIIIYRDIKPMHVFLDKNWTTKLSDLSYAISLPEGKITIQAERVMGTFGYVDPSYYFTRSVSEYTDVYSFGVFLMVVLTGRPVSFTGSDGDQEYIIRFVKGLYENGKPDEVMDPVMVKEITSVQRLQVEACVVLALRCCEKIDEDRPKMIQVAQELKRIELIKQPLDATSGSLKSDMLEDGSSGQGHRDSRLH